MNIAITFRQLEASEAVKQYATDKVAKLQKFLRKPLSAQVTLSLDKLDHVADIHVHAGSDHFHGSERSEDMYASIDKVIDKLDRQIRGSKGVLQTKKRGSEGLKTREVIEPKD
jgi:putative sigma-54 modulation protein